MEAINNLLNRITNKKEVRTQEEKRVSLNLSIAQAKELFLAAAEFHCGKPFIVDEENRQTINQLIYYFIGDERFQGDLSKGIMLCGNVGSGKTLLFKIFQELGFKQILMKTCRDIARDFALEGHKGINRYGKDSFEKKNQLTIKKNYCFVDLGSEYNQKFFGNECNVMAELIQDRYEMFKSMKLTTYFTTNLTKSEIEQKYGDRVESRIAEMCNYVVMGDGPTSTDRRKS